MYLTELQCGVVMIQKCVDCVCCHCRGHLREGLKGGEPSGSGRREGEGFDQRCKDSLNKKLSCLFSGGKSCWTTNSMNITGPL